MLARDLLSLALSICCVSSLGCTIQPKIPTVVDHRVESLLRDEARNILTVSEDRDKFSDYQFRLSEFPRADILGMSIGDGRIYISYKLVNLALADPYHRWLLRQTLAHEIGHETAGHAKEKMPVWLNRLPAGDASARDIGLPWYVRWVSYSTDAELEADRIGLGYWIKLGWDCGIWTRILEDFQKQNYTGDKSHPTDRRLRQAEIVCAEIAPSVQGILG